MLFLWVEIPLLADIYFLFSVQGSWTPDLYFANTESVLCNSKSNVEALGIHKEKKYFRFGRSELWSIQ